MQRCALLDEQLPAAVAAALLSTALEQQQQHKDGVTASSSSSSSSSSGSGKGASLLPPWLERLCIGEHRETGDEETARCRLFCSSTASCGRCSGCRRQLAAAYVLGGPCQSRWGVCTEWDAETVVGPLEAAAAANLPTYGDTQCAGLLAATTLSLRLRLAARALAFKAFSCSSSSSSSAEVNAEALAALAALAESPAGAAAVVETLVFSRFEG